VVVAVFPKSDVAGFAAVAPNKLEDASVLVGCAVPPNKLEAAGCVVAVFPNPPNKLDPPACVVAGAPPNKLDPPVGAAG
jgi:hypothetical protein